MFELMSRWGKIAIPLFFLLFIAFVVYSSMKLNRYSCEVCMDFAGGTKCATASGTTEMEARSSAKDVACASLTSGVTNSIDCRNTPPTSESCSGN